MHYIPIYCILIITNLGDKMPEARMCCFYCSRESRLIDLIWFLAAWNSHISLSITLSSDLDLWLQCFTWLWSLRNIIILIMLGFNKNSPGVKIMKIVERLDSSVDLCCYNIINFYFALKYFLKQKLFFKFTAFIYIVAHLLEGLVNKI